VARADESLDEGARAAAAQGYQERSLAMLRKATTLGWNDVAELNDHAGWDGVRGTGDWDELVDLAGGFGVP